ncbi:tyrosine--tRNA ligase, partial [bacterium]|nr:tyrosine--tRNA ligase [bacterium]
LDEKNLDILYNSEWLGKMNFSEVIQLSAKYTVARMLERNDFEKRYKGGIPISIHEFLYPLAQGMDSVALKSDVELGGTDQKFNLLVGRDLQTAYGIEPQIIITLPLLEGTDGVEKMSKSYDNYIGITDSAEHMFGKTISIPDELIVRWFDLATDISQTELGEIKAKLADDSANPRDLKRQLAREIIKVYYDENQAEQAQTAFDQIFIKKDVPDEIPEFALPENPMWIVKILRECGAVQGGGEAKRMLKGGGVSIDGEKIQTPDFDFELKDDSAVLKVGKRKFYRLVK